jgi:peptide subunit release factor 1 (eRF1)
MALTTAADSEQLSYHPIDPTVDRSAGGAVAVLTEAAVRELASIRGDRAPVTSCYLDVDGRRFVRHQDLEHEVDRLLREARGRYDGDDSVQADLARIERLVRHGIDRSKVRGLAIFSSSAEGLWEVIELPVPVHSRVLVNHAPAVGQLETVLREHEPIGVLMADRQRARMFVFEMGRLVERSELFEAGGRGDVRGERDQGVDPGQDRHTQAHLRNAASVAFEVWQQHPFEHLALAAPDPLAHELESSLHPYLRKRLSGRIGVPMAAGHNEVLAAAQAIEAEVERRREAEVVERLRAAVHADRRAVAGLTAVAEALNDRRVDTLVVSRGYVASGWRCDGCDVLAVIGRRCKRCGGEMVEVDDLVEDCVEHALTQSCQVEICVGNADLDVLGRIGALLRF